jgi:hypothetical protein
MENGERRWGAGCMSMWWRRGVDCLLSGDGDGEVERGKMGRASLGQALEEREGSERGREGATGAVWLGEQRSTGEPGETVSEGGSAGGRTE